MIEKNFYLLEVLAVKIHLRFYSFPRHQTSFVVYDTHSYAQLVASM